MDIVRQFTKDHEAYWSAYECSLAVFTSPEEQAEGIQPALAIVTCPRDSDDLGNHVARIAFKPNELDLAALAQGGTIWLSFVGTVPIHCVEVQPPGGHPRT